MDGPSNLKRLRPDETRDEDLYFEDGSVIISANDTGGNLVYFRVHKSVLARQSTVFKDMFSVPSPAEPEVDLYDGLPLVHVHDNSKELKEFLQVMYDQSFLPFRRQDPDTPALVAGPLKLATKYQADSLRNRIVSHLETDWPTTLSDWDDVAYTAVKPKPDPSKEDETSSQSSPNDSHHHTIDFCPDPIPFISLARECNLPNILATIFYSLCYNSETRREKLSRMTRGDLEMLLLGKERMMRSICDTGVHALELRWWTSPDPFHDPDRYIGCTSKKCHTIILLKWLDIVEDAMCGDPLAIFRTQALEFREFVKDNPDDFDRYYCDDDGHERDEMCIWSKDRMAEGLEELRRELFAELPSFFPL